MRDLEKDKEICDRAMPGPWIRKYVNNIEQDVTGRGICSCGYQNNGDVVKTALENANNMEFIADARKGWPHAIERAIKAEAEVERLKTDMIDYIRGATYMTKKIQGLMAENIQLRNVESAAREVVWDCPTQADLDDDEYECDKECFNGTCPTCEIFRLQKVIAELDKEGE